MDLEAAQASFMSWSKLLRCSICLGIYRRPHTLICGHSFCTSCIKSLAMLTREQFPQTPIPRLKISCPTCRKKTLVMSILTKHLSVNYSIQDFVEHWREQDKKNNGYISVRSIATQSDDADEQESDDKATDLDISAEEESRIPCRVDAISFPAFDESEEFLDGRINTEDLSEQSDSASSSSSNGDFENNLNRLVWRVHRGPEFMSFGETLWNCLAEIQDTLVGIFECRSRSVMAMIWCGYTFSIMIIANGFFPYMVLYSFLFFMILYAETSQQRRNRLRFI